MLFRENRISLVLGGGGIKGIAFSGAYEVLCQKGFIIENVAGVSAGALAGAFIAAGYNPLELKQIISSFDFEKIENNSIPNRVYAVSEYIDFYESSKWYENKSVKQFLSLDNNNRSFIKRSFISNICPFMHTKELFKNIIKYGTKGCLFDGNCIENWVYDVLAKKGVYTFGDMKNGIKSNTNPNGYKIRMLAVDATRAKLIVLPDDIKFYGINPDDLKVSQAVRMSTSIPFIFKPVKLFNKGKAYHIIDGGVLDNFPIWLANDMPNIPLVGFTLSPISAVKSNSSDKFWDILKSLIMSVHTPTVSTQLPQIEHIAQINTSEVSYLDFGLNNEQKTYLYTEGKVAAGKLFC